jgi:hypothetical protein
MLSVPKLADMVHAQDFFKCNRRKLILQMTVPTVTKISHVTSIESELQSDYERSWLIVGLWECMPISCVSCALWARSVKTATEVRVRAIQDHKVIEWNTCWKCRLLGGTDDK